MGPLAADQPFPGCAAALKCVEEQFCNMEGVMVNEPVSLTPLQKEYRVPLMVFLQKFKWIYIIFEILILI